MPDTRGKLLLRHDKAETWPWTSAHRQWLDGILKSTAVEVFEIEKVCCLSDDQRGPGDEATQA